LEEEGKQQANAFDAMTFWSALFFKTPEAFDLPGIIRASLFLRDPQNIRLESYPAFERLLSLLLRPRMERGHWFCDNDISSRLDLSDQFSTLEISGFSKIPLILQKNKSAYDLASRAMSKLDEARGRANWTEHRQYYDAVYSQNEFIRQYLIDSHNSVIDKAMRVQALSERCTIFVNILYKNLQRDVENLTKIQEKGCFSELLNALVKLRKEFE
jgi:hypothetical protein